MATITEKALSIVVLVLLACMAVMVATGNHSHGNGDALRSTQASQLADRSDDHHSANSGSSTGVGSSTLSHTWGRWYDEGTTVETRPEGFELYKTRRGDCDPNLGITYTYGGQKPTPYYPIKLFYNVAGNVAGFGITVWGKQWQNLIDKGFWIPVDNGPHYPSYEITVSFRSAPCDANAADIDLPMGTQAVVNQGRDKGSINIPLDYSGIVEGMAREGQPGWDVIGSEFTGMGIHSMYSLEGTAVGSGLRGVPPVELGEALPVVAMYRPVKGADGNAKIGQLNSVFFWSATSQDAKGLPLLWPTGKEKLFDGPLGGVSGPGFCDNWCGGNSPMGGVNYARKFGQAGYECNFAAVDESVPAGNDGRANWETDGLPCVADTFHFQLFNWSSPYMASADTLDRVCSTEIPAIHGNFDGALVKNVPKDTIAHAQCCYTHTMETALAS